MGLMTGANSKQPIKGGNKVTENLSTFEAEDIHVIYIYISDNV